MVDQVTFLGTGSSNGIPVIGCKCSICDSKEIKDSRLRSSVLINTDGKNILIDASPDFRANALTYKIDKIDYCFLSHLHFDHVAGVDDLRAVSFFQKRKPRVIMQECMRDGFLVRYNYLKKHIDFEFLSEDQGNYVLNTKTIKYFTYGHANLKVMGLRFDNFAYLTDIKEYDHSMFDQLKGIDLLVIAATRLTESPLHLTLDEAIEFARKTDAKKVYLTHISHEICHNSVSRHLPEGFYLAYDGLKLSI